MWDEFKILFKGWNEGLILRRTFIAYGKLLYFTFYLSSAEKLYVCLVFIILTHPSAKSLTSKLPAAQLLYAKASST